MTRRTFETEDFRVITGWDRPLPHHFLKMYPRHSPALYPDPVYSNLLDHDDAAMSLEEIADTLRHYGIPTPEGLWRDLAEDQALNRRPLEVSYDAPERGAMTVRQADERSAEVEVFRDARWKPMRDGGWRLLGTTATGRRLALQVIEGAGTPDHDLAPTLMMQRRLNLPASPTRTGSATGSWTGSTRSFIASETASPRRIRGWIVDGSPPVRPVEAGLPCRACVWPQGM